MPLRSGLLGRVDLGWVNKSEVSQFDTKYALGSTEADAVLDGILDSEDTSGPTSTFDARFY
jgi:hypothetical protein